MVLTTLKVYIKESLKFIFIARAPAFNVQDYFISGRRNGSWKNASVDRNHLDPAQTGSQWGSTRNQASPRSGPEFSGQELAERIRKVVGQRKDRRLRS